MAKLPEPFKWEVTREKLYKHPRAYLKKLEAGLPLHVLATDAHPEMLLVACTLEPDEKEILFARFTRHLANAKEQMYNAMAVATFYNDAFKPILDILQDDKTQNYATSTILRTKYEPPWSITLQRPGGITPADKIAALEAELAQVKADLQCALIKAEEATSNTPF